MLLSRAALHTPTLLPGLPGELGGASIPPGELWPARLLIRLTATPISMEKKVWPKGHVKSSTSYYHLVTEKKLVGSSE